MEDSLLTLSEAADRLGVGRETVYRWVRDGVLNGILLPSGRRPSYRVRESMIATMIMVADRAGQDITSRKPAYDWLSVMKAFGNAL